MPAVGDVIAGKYRVERQIGAGGMGTVVAATHVQLGTPVALKFLSDKIRDSAGSIERFTREARASAALRGEHICRVSDFGLHDGMPYIAMELLDGIDLAQLIANTSTATGMAVDFILQACSGLAEAHERGIVHRDLKPGNLFLTRRPDGTPLVKVLDFGVAKIPQADDASLTKTSSVIGSPGYMAPEQLRSSKTVDNRADIWALGVILYELISKRHPFAAEAVTEIALKIAMDEPEPLVEAPDGLRAVVMRCLEKEPDGRFPDIASLSAALEPFAVRDRAAAIAAAKLWIEAPWSRPLLPTTKGTAAPRPRTPSGYEVTEAAASFAATHAAASHAPTQAAASFAATHASPPASVAATHASPTDAATHASPPPIAATQVAPAEAAPKRGRAIAIALIAALVIGGVVAFAMTRGGGSTPIDAGPIATAPPDAAASAPALPDAMLVVDANVVAVVVDAAPPPTTTRRPPGPGSAKPTKPPGPGSAKPPGPGSAKPPGPGSAATAGPGSATVATGSGSGSAVTQAPVVDERREAEAAAGKAAATMGAKGLSWDDLGEPAQALKTEISNGRKAKDWATVKDAGNKLSVLVNGVVVDRAFLQKKSARLTAKMKTYPPNDQSKDQLLKLQSDADELTNQGRFVQANLMLNQAFLRLPFYQPPGVPNY